MKKGLSLVLLLIGSAHAQEPVKPTPTVAAEIMSWEMENDACQGGDHQACRYRDADLLAIQAAGWCLSDDQKWQPAPCKSAPLSDTILGVARDAMPVSLQKDYSDFAARLTSPLPLTLTEEGWLVGRGSMIGSDDTDAAAWALSTNSGKKQFGAIIKKDGKFFIYGSTEDIPTPLAAWGVANGMTESNMVRR
jgi:hypothetical protein